jgi:aminomethyltransferase
VHACVLLEEWEIQSILRFIEEHLAVRNKAGLFDVSHMGEARIRGKDAAKFLDAIMTNEFSNLRNNHARYTIMCYPVRRMCG